MIAYHMYHMYHMCMYIYIYMSNRQDYCNTDSVLLRLQLAAPCGAGPHVPLPHAGHSRFRWGAQGYIQLVLPKHGI